MGWYACLIRGEILQVEEMSSQFFVAGSRMTACNGTQDSDFIRVIELQWFNGNTIIGINANHFLYIDLKTALLPYLPHNHCGRHFIYTAPSANEIMLKVRP